MRLEQLGGCREAEARIEQPLEEEAPRFATGTQEIDRCDLRAGLTEADGGLRAEHVVQIVHDLKNPLHTIALETTILQHKLAGQQAVDAGPALDRILGNIEYLDRMVNDLLDACSPEETRRTLALAPTDLRVLLESVIERNVSTRDRDRVFLEAEYPVMVIVDDLRIQRVVANLLSNALKYSPLDGHVVVRLELHDAHCTVSVIDAGSGVTPAEASFIFDKYRRTRTARIREGSGLGLYVSRQIVEAHGGRIEVECVDGIGSRFYFELPIAKRSRS
jgi:signal transduction histidine kinase